MNKVGIYFAFWTPNWDADFVYYIDKVSRLGFDILEISTSSLLDLSTSNLDIIKNRARDKGIELTYCIGFPKDKDMASDNAATRKNGVEYAKKTLETIHYLGGSIFGGINYSCWPGTLDEGIYDKRPYLERSIDSMRKVAGTAEDFGIYYCLEVVNRFEQYLLNTAQEAVDFIDEIGSPNVKMLLDTFHMNIEEDSIYKAVLTASDKLGHLHIGENNRKTPGSGNIPWGDLMSALRHIEYKGHIVMEPFMKMGGEVGRDIKVWRDLSNNADEEMMDTYAKDALEFIRDKQFETWNK